MWQYQNKRENDVTKQIVVNQIGAIQQIPSECSNLLYSLTT